jgi:hypothetical protein
MPTNIQYLHTNERRFSKLSRSRINVARVPIDVFEISHLRLTSRIDIITLLKCVVCVNGLPHAQMF